MIELDLQNQYDLLLTLETKHGGPGPHSTGSPQLAHGGGRASGTASGLRQGKGPAADRATLGGALAGWERVSGDRGALADRLDGWTHSETHTANRLREARKAGEVEFEGGANRVARELFARIRAQEGEVAKPEPDDDAVTLDALKTRDYVGDQGYVARVNGRDYDVVDTIEGWGVQPDTVKLVDRETLESRRVEVDEIARLTRDAAAAEQVDDPFYVGTATRGALKRRERARAQLLERIEAGNWDEDRARADLEDLQQQLIEMSDDPGWPVTDAYQLFEDRYDTDEWLQMLASGRAQGRRGTVTLKVPSYSEVELGEDAALRIIARHAHPTELKHLGPGPHPSGSPQLAHAGGRGLATRKKRRSSLPTTKAGRIARGDDWDHPMPAGRYVAGDPRNDPLYAAYSRRIDDLSAAYLAEHGDTYAQHSVDTGMRDDEGRPIRVMTPERILAHKAIVDAVLADAEAREIPRDEGRAWILGGMPGAGKTYSISNRADLIPGLEVDEDGNPTNAVVVNPDDAKTALVDAGLAPDVEGLTDGEKASILHEESSLLAESIARAVIDAGYNAVFDVTLNNDERSRKKYVDPALRRGYSDFTAVFVDAELATALHGMGMRHKGVNPETGIRGYSGRYVPYDLVIRESAPDGAAKSVNRESYDRLIAADAIGRAVRFDRETGEVYVDKGGDG